MLRSRLGTRWSDVDVTKSLQGRDREQGLLQGTEVLLRNGDDTRSSPHPSVVAFRVLRWRR